MNHEELLAPEAILLDLSAADADGVLHELTEGLVRVQPAFAPHSEAIRAALAEREAKGSTGSLGVAIPHVRMAELEHQAMVLGIHQEGVDFAALDGEPVHVFFAVVGGETQAEEHLQVLRWIAGIAQHPDFVSFARQASSVEQVLELLKELAPA